MAVDWEWVNIPGRTGGGEDGEVWMPTAPDNGHAVAMCIHFHESSEGGSFNSNLFDCDGELPGEPRQTRFSGWIVTCQSCSDEFPGGIGAPIGGVDLLELASTVETPESFSMVVQGKSLDLTLKGQTRRLLGRLKRKIKRKLRRKNRIR
jgi:hypothetical protein